MLRRLARSTLTLCALLLAGCAPPDDVIVTGATMGTTYRIRIARCELHDCAAVVGTLAAERLAELTAALSHYENESDLSRFNKAAPDVWVPAGVDVINVVTAAQALSRQTDGHFDATVLHAATAWGFGPGATAAPPGPDADRVRAAADVTDFRQVEVRTAPPALRKRRAGVGLDLSGIAKGYAVDQLAYLLDARGVANYIVEIGGELRARGTQAGGQPWRIGIETPTQLAGPPTPAVDYIITPGLQAVATSGDYRNFYVRDGQRIAHTIDPRTGTPVDHPLAGVSVIAPGATEADGLATALMVMGPAAARDFASTHSLAVLLFERDGDRVSAWMSDEFAALLLQR